MTESIPPVERHSGRTIEANGRKYVVPALSFGDSLRLAEEIKRMQSPEASETEKQQTVVRVVHAALLRNYPNLTTDQVRDEILDLANWKDLLFTVLGVSGFEQGEPGKAVAGSPSISGSSPAS